MTRVYVRIADSECRVYYDGLLEAGKPIRCDVLGFLPPHPLTIEAHVYDERRSGLCGTPPPAGGRVLSSAEHVSCTKPAGHAPADQFHEWESEKGLRLSWT